MLWDCLVSDGSWLFSCGGMVWCLSSVLSPLGAGTLTALRKEGVCLHVQLHSPPPCLPPPVSHSPAYQIMLLYLYTV